jgi:hypothetical protein
MADEPNITVPEASPLRRRLLNIGSIVCLALCVALMGMWVRSYQSSDEVVGHISVKLGFTVGSASGRLYVCFRTSPDHLPWWTITSFRLTDLFGADDPPKRDNIFERLGFEIDDVYPDSSTMYLPYWFVVLLCGLAIAFRIRWPLRFTLRSLFIVTTVLAVVLGMIAWLDRAWIGK